ncbi:MAG: hypothetical protein GOVbin258_6 [Prokaryotic dsDNA virus sp.]|nr:hypothetical protein [Hyphomonadaceae bacterium]QDP63678.1 MAG: hypothetical protein GOVbin258_6 [Prokaryotic dsDNA virus sp.]|tara:strand:+ start:45295 stop:45903 length:609 start_codon:yes stop_codon:yes gene_type:complete
MVRALLAGRKSQTRRITPCPLSKVEVGDLLYVREAFTIQENQFYSTIEGRFVNTCLDFAATRTRTWFNLPAESLKPAWERRSDADGGPFMRPAMFCPRAASRLTLRVNRVFFDPIQRISATDAIAEGITPNPNYGDWGGEWMNYPEGSSEGGWECPRDSFRSLWDSLHTKPGETWADNPMVVALQFEVIHANVDTLKELADG